MPVHYLRPNHTSWTPPALFSFDTETRSELDGDNEVMTMRLWCARFTDRRPPKRITPVDTIEHGMFPEDIAVWLHGLCRRRRTVWGYAHNLGFDLRTSGLIENLVAMQWDVTEFAVNSGAPFVRLRNGDSSLTLSDSWSWFQCRLETIADAMGMRKPPLPKPSDTETEWLARCMADTNILHDAMLTLMEWWETNGLGRWNVTGSASGHNAMRHIPSQERVLIRPDDTECDHDRRAIYGGKRFAWISGDAQYGHYTEVDIEKAYTNVARHYPLPSGRQCKFESLPNDTRWLGNSKWGFIAGVELCTDKPRYPVRAENHVWYPVGRFHTTLASPEIKEARDAGHLVAIGPGWLHKLGYAMRPWATWCLESMADESGATPDVAKLVHRMWGRSAIGKWAQRGFEVVEIGPSPNQGWNHEEAWHHGKNVPASIVDFAGRRYQVAAVNQSDNAYPAILAFVESHVRTALGRAIDITGDKHMVACDTDGYIADHIGADMMDDVNDAIAPLKVRAKRHYRRIKVIGPQHLELDTTRRRSGIPSSAEKGADGKLHAWTWPKLAWQLNNGRPGAYIRPHRTYTLATTYAPGWVLTDGSVVPVEIGLDAAGGNAITPWPQTRYARSGAALAPEQNRHLERHINE